MRIVMQTLGAVGLAALLLPGASADVAHLGDGTRVSGSESAIANTQTAPAHYYSRPDADYLHYDSRLDPLP